MNARNRLTRCNLRDGSMRRDLALPDELAWSEAQIEQSFLTTWSERPPGPVWVFGYGSLIWNPLLHWDAQHNARLQGWHRSFCLRSVAGRGRPENPGRLLALRPGGAVDGVVLRLVEDDIEAELRLLWAREMSTGAYRPAWVPVQLPEGMTLRALTFLGRPEHPLFEQDAEPATVAGPIARAAGAFGSNLDYLHQLAQALQARGLHDPYVEAVLQATTSPSPHSTGCRPG